MQTIRSEHNKSTPAQNHWHRHSHLSSNTAGEKKHLARMEAQQVLWLTILILILKLLWPLCTLENIILYADLGENKSNQTNNTKTHYAGSWGACHMGNKKKTTHLCSLRKQFTYYFNAYFWYLVCIPRRMNVLS